MRLPDAFQIAQHQLRSAQPSTAHVILQLVDRRLFQGDAVTSLHGEPFIGNVSKHWEVIWVRVVEDQRLHRRDLPGSGIDALSRGNCDRRRRGEQQKADEALEHLSRTGPARGGVSRSCSR